MAKLSVVIPVMNEKNTIAKVLRQVSGLHDDMEVIVVSNGSTDGTKRIAEQWKATIITYPIPLGHDVGRSIGAKKAKGDILLFTDGDIVIPQEELRKFVTAVQSGADVALNQYCGPARKRNAHSVVVAKHALNIALARPDLGGASMTAIPHALSRKALNQIGANNLSVPPKAQAIAVLKGLAVTAAHYVDVGRKNPRRRRRRRSAKDPLEKIIIGDHLEAIHWLAEAAEDRGPFPDLLRRREAVWNDS
jgi:glycosyltransferase involved in cell wall biosynthesis